MTASIDVLDDASAGEPMLTSTLLTTLDRPPFGVTLTRPMVAVATGLATAGLWPAWDIARRLSAAIRWRRSIFEHVVDWSRLEIGSETAAALEPHADDRASRYAVLGSQALAVLAALVGVAHLIGGGSLTRLWLIDPFRGSGPIQLLSMLFLCFIGGSFALTWLAGNWHARTGVAFARKAEETVAPDALPPWRRPPRWDFGFGLLSTTVGGVLALLGVTWALPLVVAATAQRRVVRSSDRAILQRVGAIVRLDVSKRRPGRPVPAAVDRYGQCPHEGCDASIAYDAAFCPRCGRAVGNDQPRLNRR